MAKVTPRQETDEENMSASDVNMVGPQETQTIEDRRAGGMSPAAEYAHDEPFHGKQVTR